MDQLLEDISKLIYYYLKINHKEKISYDLTKEILEKIYQPAPIWYIHG